MTMKKPFIINPILYWIISLTWGLMMTVIGVVVTLFVLTFMKGKIHRNGYGFITEVGGNWGGLEMGPFALCGSYTAMFYDMAAFDSIRAHEFGHSLQNLIWGPLFLFVIGIPSATRYWYREYLYRHNKLVVTSYDAIWFEGQATKWGEMYKEHLPNF